jgi:putative alpha-1,2-mannosidase
MNNPIKTLISLTVLIFFTVNAANAQTKPVYTRYVNTFIGTAPLNDPKILGYKLPDGWRSWAGLTFPGSSLPNAMVQLSPITAYGSGAGYQYEDSVIYGFTHTNKGHWNLCNIPILPLSNPQGSKFGSKFSHTKESSAPGFYQVYLADYNVNVSLTSTLRCGYHKYEFKNNTNRQILFDLGKANSRVSTWRIEQVGPNAIQGFQGGENVYFYATINTKINKLEKTDEGQRSGYAMLFLADGGTGPVELKIGLSFVSEKNAKENLEKEIGSKSFNVIRSEASKTWEKLLSTIQVKGGTKNACFIRACTVLFYGRLCAVM